MARIGKIGRLPMAVRAQLNSRLQDGHEGKLIVRWLNSLPEVKQVLAEGFDGRPISEQNLTDWRQGGYQEWVAYQEILAQAGDLAANRQELQSVAPGQSLADHLAAAVGFRFGAILAAQGVELDEGSLTKLKALTHVCQAVVKLRRSDQNAVRLKMDTERWELEREQQAEEKAEAAKARQRETLAAPVLGILKQCERVPQFGGGKAGQFAAEYLQEIETCEDPSHFQSKVLASKTPAEWARYMEEMEKESATRKTPMQEALDLYHEMEDGLRNRNPERKATSAQQGAKARRQARKPADPEARRSNATTPAVQPAESAQPNDKVQPAPAPAAQPDPAPSAPDSGLTTPAPAIRNPQSPIRNPPAPDSGLSATAPVGGADVVKSVESALSGTACPGRAGEGIKANQA